MKKMPLTDRIRRLRLALLVAIDRGPLADSKRVHELFREWQRLATELKRLQEPKPRRARMR